MMIKFAAVLFLGISLVNASPVPWASLTKVHSEPLQRYGVEFELGWAGAPFGGMHKMAGKGMDNPCGGHKMPKDFQDFAVTNGHNIVYAPKPGSPFSKWHFSLDGEVYLELVSDPLTIGEMEKELQLIKSAIPTNGRDLVKLLTAEFTRVYPRPDVYDWFECHVGQKTTKRGHVFPNSQLTTTLTDSELTMCHNMLATRVKASFPTNKMPKEILAATVYKEGEKLHMPFLIKHAIEQFDATVPAGVAAAGGTIDKVTEPMGLHTSANKLAPLFDRNGETAWVIEVRSKEDPINLGLMTFMNDADHKFWAPFKKMLVCPPHRFY